LNVKTPIKWDREGWDRFQDLQQPPVVVVRCGAWGVGSPGLVLEHERTYRAVTDYRILWSQSRERFQLVAQPEWRIPRSMGPGSRDHTVVNPTRVPGPHGLGPGSQFPLKYPLLPEWSLLIDGMGTDFSSSR
jgi:hypothetical protein